MAGVSGSQLATFAATALYLPAEGLETHTILLPADVAPGDELQFT